MNALVCEDFCVRRGWRRIFTGLSFELPEGGALLLRGPNGAGKSTLLRALAGFVEFERGDARFGGISLRRERSTFVETLTYTGHLDAIKPALGVEETLALHADLMGVERSRVAQALEAMGLSHLAGESVRILSAGQKRRLGLARLALSDRPLWLMDEPTVSLDAESAERVAALARAHCAKGGMVIAATHIDLAIPEAAVLDPSAFAPEPPKAGIPAEDDPALTGESW